MQKTKATAIPTAAIVDLSAAAGPVIIRMTNDYLFRALLQRSNRVLKSLICSLLHLTADEISSVEITNSIELGAAIDEKEFILDIKVRNVCSISHQHFTVAILNIQQHEIQLFAP